MIYSIFIVNFNNKQVILYIIKAYLKLFYLFFYILIKKQGG